MSVRRKASRFSAGLLLVAACAIGPTAAFADGSEASDGGGEDSQTPPSEECEDGVPATASADTSTYATGDSVTITGTCFEVRAAVSADIIAEGDVVKNLTSETDGHGTVTLTFEPTGEEEYTATLKTALSEANVAFSLPEQDDPSDDTDPGDGGESGSGGDGDGKGDDDSGSGQGDEDSDSGQGGEGSGSGQEDEGSDGGADSGDEGQGSGGSNAGDDGNKDQEQDQGNGSSAGDGQGKGSSSGGGSGEGRADDAGSGAGSHADEDGDGSAEGASPSGEGSSEDDDLRASSGNENPSPRKPVPQQPPEQPGSATNDFPSASPDPTADQEQSAALAALMTSLFANGVSSGQVGTSPEDARTVIDPSADASQIEVPAGDGSGASDAGGSDGGSAEAAEAGSGTEESDGDELAATGTNALATAALAGLAILGGAGLLWWQRRSNR